MLVNPNMKTEGTEVSSLDRVWGRTTEKFRIHWNYLNTPFQSSSHVTGTFFIVVISWFIIYLVNFTFCSLVFFKYSYHLKGVCPK